MADNVQPDAGEQREESSSGLLLSVDPLRGADNYKLAGGGDSDGGDKGGLLGDDRSDADGSDKGGLLGDDSSDADNSDLLGGDNDGSDASDADGSDAGGSGGSGGSDADGSDAGGIAADSDQADEQMNPLGIGDTNVDGTGSNRTDAR